MDGKTVDNYYLLLDPHAMSKKKKKTASAGRHVHLLYMEISAAVEQDGSVEMIKSADCVNLIAVNIPLFMQ